MLTQTQVRAYLQRIGYTGSTEPTLHTLRNLHMAHLLLVPFENLSICAKEPILLDEPALFEKIVSRRRGGFCYELNGLFASLLRALDFQVTLLSARVPNDEGRPVPEFDHLVLQVSLAEPWLADVGFGDGFRQPLRMHSPRTQTQGGSHFHITPEGSDWVVQRLVTGTDWQEEFRYTLVPRSFDEFEPMCHYHQTSPESPFTHKRVCSLATPDGRVTLSNMRLITTRFGVRQERALRDEAEVRLVLDEVFGIPAASGSH